MFAKPANYLNESVSGEKRLQHETQVNKKMAFVAVLPMRECVPICEKGGSNKLPLDLPL